MACQSSYTKSSIRTLSNRIGPVTARVASGSRWRNLWILLTVVVALTGATLAGQVSTAILVGYRDHQYPSGVAGNREVTSEKPESKLWWNDGYWWASMWSGGSDGAYHIFRLDVNSQDWIDTGTELDPRIGSRADVLWDGTKLYVASHLWDGSGGQETTPANSGKLFRYSYNASTDTYSRDSGYPVNVNSARSETLVIDKDSTGQLWATWVQDNKVMISHSVGGNDAVWATPFPLDHPAATTSSDGDDISSVIAYGGHVGLMWSNQQGDEEMYFAVHEDGADPDDWAVEVAFSLDGDDHINLKKLGTDDDGNIYAAIKGGSSTYLIVVLVCQWDPTSFCSETADWDYAVVYNTKDHNPTRPIVLIDTTNDDLYVFTRNHDENQDDGIYYKVSNLNNLSFSPGDIGIPFIKSETETGINDPTSTKQNVNSTTGLAVMASDKSARYYFHNYLPLDGIRQYTLTVDQIGEGSVTQNPEGTVFNDGDTVQLTATPADGWKFDGWFGDVSSTQLTIEITMDADKSVTAQFSELPPDQRTLNVNLDPVAGGSVTLDPPGGVYAVDTTVTLTAEAAPSWHFTGWSGDVTGNSPSVQIVMNTNKTVTAHFEQITTYALTVDVDGPGTVELDPPWGIYPQGTEVTLTAEPVQDWAFGGWGGDLTGTTNPITLTMDSDKTVTATFIWPEHLLTVNTLGSGSVTRAPHDGPYQHGEEVTLTAVGEPGWTFSNWSGDLTGTDNPATLTMDGPKEVTATFVQKETGIQIQVSADPITGTLSQELTYTYIVANIGEATLNDVAVVDDRLGAVTLDKTTLASGETAVGQLTYQPVLNDLPGPLGNTATATATSTLGEEVSHSDTILVALRQLSFIYYMPLGFSSGMPAATAAEHTEQSDPGLLIIHEIEPQR